MSAESTSEKVLKEGWLLKRGRRWLLWQRRYVRVLEGGTLWWGKRASPDESTKTLGLTALSARVGLLDPGRTRKHAFAVVSGARVTVYAADGEGDAAAWLEAMARYVTLVTPVRAADVPAGGFLEVETAVSPTASPASPHLKSATSALISPKSAPTLSPSSVGAGGGLALDGFSSVDSAGTPGSGDALPDEIELDGFAEVGAELHVRVRDGRLLDSLSMLWFRFTGAVLPEPAGLEDIFLDTRVKAILGATGHTYTVTAADVGNRIGCCVRTASASASRWTIMSDTVVTVDPEQLTVRLTLLPHEHNKYCDRRVRVCTAAGRHREGNVVRALVRGPPDRLAAPHYVQWYRSDALPDHTTIDPGKPTVVIPTEPPAVSGARPRGASDQFRRHQGAISQRVSRMFHVKDLTFHRVCARPLSDMPKLPPDHAPAPTIAQIYEHVSLLTQARPPPPVWAMGEGVGVLEYPMFCDDVGRMLCAVVLHGEMAPPATLSLSELAGAGVASPCMPSPGRAGVLAVSQLIGPIEAAPPRAREIWIEGELRVGCLLTGHAYYYGGYEGDSEVSWIAIRADGETVELKPPTPSNPSVPLPSLDAPAGSPADTHPRVLRLLPEHAECMIKFKVRPVRADGDSGHAESSRPTKEVQHA